MEAHTPKREAIEKFIGHESGNAPEWIIRVTDQGHEPVVHLQAWSTERAEGAPEKSLEVHTRQVRLFDDELDEATKMLLIRRWLHSLGA